jgi:hypothetical protein
MLSVGGAEWAEAAAEREAHLSAAAEETADLARQPDVELAELVAYYEAKGPRPRTGARGRRPADGARPRLTPSWRASTASLR